MTEEGAVVERDLTVYGEQIAAAGDDERVNLGEAGVAADVGVVEALGDGGEAARVFFGQIDALGEDARLVIA